jgi:hypothetical protein
MRVADLMGYDLLVGRHIQGGVVEMAVVAWRIEQSLVLETVF